MLRLRSGLYSSFYLHFYGAGVQLCTFKGFLFTSALKEWIPLMDHRNQPHSLVYLCKWIRMAHFVFIADVGNEFGDDPGKVAIYHFFNKFNPLELSIHLLNDPDGFYLQFNFCVHCVRWCFQIEMERLWGYPFHSTGVRYNIKWLMGCLYRKKGCHR